MPASVAPDAGEAEVRISAFNEAVDRPRLDRTLEPTGGAQFLGMARGAVVQRACPRITRAVNWRSLYPDTPEEVAAVDRDRFLRLVTITHGGVDCTVGDIIDVVAHAFGGVHHGQLWSDGNRALAVLEKEVLIYEESMVLHSLHDIGKVTVKALIPLAEAILRRQDTPDSAVAHATTP